MPPLADCCSDGEGRGCAAVALRCCITCSCVGASGCAGTGGLPFRFEPVETKGETCSQQQHMAHCYAIAQICLMMRMLWTIHLSARMANNDPGLLLQQLVEAAAEVMDCSG